jgi:transposase
LNSALQKGSPFEIGFERQPHAERSESKMDSEKYVGMDVDKETISIAVVDSSRKLVKESILETKASTILEFIRGLRGNMHVTFEERTWAAWLCELLKPHVTKVVVCNPRKNALLKAGNKGDKSDARNLAELLRRNFLTPVYHGGTDIRTLKELTRSYLTISKDLTRVMNRLKALYRGGAFRAGVHKSTRRATVPNGSARSLKPVCAATPSTSTNS